MRVVVLGGCGYIGSVLVPKLLDEGHEVQVIDAQWFGNHLKAHRNLTVTQADIREPLSFKGAVSVIHLANVANDPAGDLDPKLTWEVNALGMAQVADTAVRDGVEQFIYASSGSVYGLSDAQQLYEDSPLVPLTEYNKSKMVAERVLMSYTDQIGVHIIRPGTCCGVSPRQRLDITVNGMTYGACKTGEIKVRGGEQVRPNVHIQDLTDLFLWMLRHPELVGIWNAGFENLTGFQIARIVSKYCDGHTVEAKSADRRSYRMNSSKLLKAGFQPKHTVEEAVQDLVKAYDKFPPEDECINLRTMRHFAIA